MDDPYVGQMMELCTSLGAMQVQGHTHCEEEALLYLQLCRTLTLKAKIDELAIEASIEEINQKLQRDDEEPPTVPA